MRQLIWERSWNGTWFRDCAESDAATECCQYCAFFFGIADFVRDRGLWERLVTKCGPLRDAEKVCPELAPANSIFGYYMRFDMLLRTYGREEVELRWPVDHVRCVPEIWREWTAAMARNRLNTIVMDLGEAMVYPSHPELAVKGSLTPTQMREGLARLRDLGLTPLRAAVSVELHAERGASGICGIRLGDDPSGL